MNTNTKSSKPENACLPEEWCKSSKGFLAQLDVDELPLFFWLLIKPLLSIHQGEYETNKSFWNLSGSPRDEVDTSNVMKHFTMESINALSWKKKELLNIVFGNYITTF